MSEMKTPFGTVVGLIPTPPPEKVEEKLPEKPKRPSRAKAKE